MRKASRRKITTSAVTMELSEQQVSAYLKRHPVFVREWYTEHTTTEQRQQWQSQDPAAADDDDDRTANRPSDSQPVSKCKPTRSNSITTTLFHDVLHGTRNAHRMAVRAKSRLLEMSEREVFMELIRDIASEMDVNILCHKIILNVSMLTKSDRGSLFLLRGPMDNRYLVSKLFDVTETASLEECLHTEEQQIRVPLGKGIAGHVALTKEIVNIKNAYEVSVVVAGYEGMGIPTLGVGSIYVGDPLRERESRSISEVIFKYWVWTMG